MYLVTHKSQRYVTNASEADLKLMARRNSNFTFEPIEYVPVDQVRSHREIDQVLVAKLAKRVPAPRPVFSATLVDSIIDEFFDDEAEE